MPKLRAVLDANVLISAFLTPAGRPARLVRLAVHRVFELYLSRQIREEAHRALVGRSRLRDRHGYPVDAAERYLDSVVQADHATAEPAPLSGVVRDPSDDAILACALAYQADLVTGDRDLLSLGRYEGVRIVTPADFLARVEAHRP